MKQINEANMTQATEMARIFRAAADGADPDYAFRQICKHLPIDESFTSGPHNSAEHAAAKIVSMALGAVATVYENIAKSESRPDVLPRPEE
jgi:hypothetical protein